MTRTVRNFLHMLLLAWLTAFLGMAYPALACSPNPDCVSFGRHSPIYETEDACRTWFGIQANECLQKGGDLESKETMGAGCDLYETDGKVGYAANVFCTCSGPCGPESILLSDHS